jgi:hypothetical protein
MLSNTAAAPIDIALEQADGSIYRWRTAALPAGHPNASLNFLNLERQVKFLLWSRGGHRIYVQGPGDLASKLQRHYAETETGKFDTEIMGHRIFERPFEVVAVGPGEVPAETFTSKPLGRHLNGCRIGFDRASDRKAAAVVDGTSCSVKWTGIGPQTDPQ